MKYGEHGTDVHLFGKLLDTNCSYFETKYICKGIDLLEKKSTKLYRCESFFRNIKLDLPEIIKLLTKILGKKIENSPDGKNIQSRIREYFSNPYSSKLLEIDGISFLNIVRKEAVRIVRESSQAETEYRHRTSNDRLNTVESDIYNIDINEDSHMGFSRRAGGENPVEMAKNFYTIGKIFKPNGIEPLSTEFMNSIKEYQEVKKNY